MTDEKLITSADILTAVRDLRDLASPGKSKTELAYFFRSKLKDGSYPARWISDRNAEPFTARLLRGCWWKNGQVMLGLESYGHFVWLSGSLPPLPKDPTDAR